MNGSTYPTFAGTSTIVIVNCVINVPLMLTSILGNTLVLAAILSSSSLRSRPSILLLCGLAVSDLAVGLVVQPFYIASELRSSDFPASWMRAMAFAFCGVSFATMALISVDRVLALHYHMSYNTLVTSPHIILAIAVIWLIHLLLSSGIIFFNKSTFASVGLVLVGVYITAATVSYIHIYRIVRRHQLQIRVQQQAVQSSNALNLASLKRTAMNTFVFYICTILCYFPWFIYRRYHSDIFLPNTAWSFTATLVFANSALNPFLYCWRLRELQTAVKNTLIKMLPCKQTGEN